MIRALAALKDGLEQRRAWREGAAERCEASVPVLEEMLQDTPRLRAQARDLAGAARLCQAGEHEVDGDMSAWAALEEHRGLNDAWTAEVELNLRTWQAGSPGEMYNEGQGFVRYDERFDGMFRWAIEQREQAIALVRAADAQLGDGRSAAGPLS